MVVSYICQQKALFSGSIILIATGLYFQFNHLMHFFEFNYGIALASLRVVFIICGSYLEANAENVKRWMSRNKNRIAQWEY